MNTSSSNRTETEIETETETSKLLCVPLLPQGISLDLLPKGQYCGRLPAIRRTDLLQMHQSSRFWTFFHHKRWQYLALSSDDFFCALAVVDLGWTNTAFAFVFDKKTAKEIAGFSLDGIPGISATIGDTIGQACGFKLFSTSIQMECVQGQFYLRLDSDKFQIQAQFEFPQDTAILSVLGSVPHAGSGKTSFHSTQKSSACSFTGQLVLADKHYELNNGVASFDYSNGLLPRRTEWLWASAHGLQCGFNLQQGYFSDQENAIWIDGEIISISQVQFEFNPDNPRLPWHLRSDDGIIDLVFNVTGIHAENKNRLIASSQYIQAIGHFSGSVKLADGRSEIHIDALDGVTEHHRAVW